MSLMTSILLGSATMLLSHNQMARVRITISSVNIGSFVGFECFAIPRTVSFRHVIFLSCQCLTGVFINRVQVLCLCRTRSFSFAQEGCHAVLRIGGIPNRDGYKELLDPKSDRQQHVIIPGSLSPHDQRLAMLSFILILVLIQQYVKHQKTNCINHQ